MKPLNTTEIGHGLRSPSELIAQSLLPSFISAPFEQPDYWPNVDHVFPPHPASVMQQIQKGRKFAILTVLTLHALLGLCNLFTARWHSFFFVNIHPISLLLSLVAHLLQLPRHYERLEK